MFSTGEGGGVATTDHRTEGKLNDHVKERMAVVLGDATSSTDAASWSSRSSTVRPRASEAATDAPRGSTRSSVEACPMEGLRRGGGEVAILCEARWGRSTYVRVGCERAGAARCGWVLPCEDEIDRQTRTVWVRGVEVEWIGYRLVAAHREVIEGPNRSAVALGRVREERLARQGPSFAVARGTCSWSCPASLGDSTRECLRPVALPADRP